MKLTIALLSLSAAMAVHAASEAAIPGYLPPDTKVVIGLRVRNLAESSIFQKIPSNLASVGADWAKMAAAVGFDPFHDLDDVLIATNAKGQDAPALIVAHGRFDKLQLPTTGALYHGVRINQGKGANGSMALLDETTAVLGDPALVRRAIDHRDSASPLDPAFLAILNSLRVSYDIWGYGHVPPGLVPPSANSQGVESIDRFQFGLRLTHGLEVEATLHTRSSEDGQKLVAGARLIEAMVKAQQPSISSGRFDIHTENNAVRISLSVPEDELLKAIEARQNASMRAPSTGRGVTVVGPGVSVVGPGVSVAPAEPVIRSAPNGDTMTVTLPGKK